MLLTQRFQSAALDLRRTSWSQLAGYAYLAFLMVLLVRLAAPETMGAALRKLVFVLPRVRQDR